MKLRELLPNLGRPLGRILTVLLFVVLIGVVVWANCSAQDVLFGKMTGKDFMGPWVGGKAIVLGLNPYDVAVWRPLRAAYGAEWMPDPISPTPLWAHLFFVPLSFLDIQVAGAIWMTICEFSLVLGTSLIARALGWESRFAIFTISKVRRTSADCLTKWHWG